MCSLRPGPVLRLGQGHQQVQAVHAGTIAGRLQLHQRHLRELRGEEIPGGVICRQSAPEQLYPDAGSVQESNGDLVPLL